MKSLEVINNLSIGMFFCITVLTLLIVGCVSFAVGRKFQDNTISPFSESISTNVLGLLALILGFSFSMAIDRYERRKSLALDEAIAIGIAYLRSEVVKFDDPEKNKELFKTMTDLRIKAHLSSNPEEVLVEVRKIRGEIWKNFKKLAAKERGELESAYLQSLNEMTATAHLRNYALLIMLPASFYFLILIIASASVGMMNFDRGLTNDANHSRSFLFIVLFAVLLSFIYDMDHFKSGLVQVSQEPLMKVRSLME